MTLATHLHAPSDSVLKADGGEPTPLALWLGMYAARPPCLYMVIIPLYHETSNKETHTPMSPKLIRSPGCYNRENSSVHIRC